MFTRVFLALCLVALAAGPAWAMDIGIGVFAGPSFPVIQQDAGKGTTYGLYAPVSLMSAITIEPYYALYKMGEASRVVEGYGTVTRSAFDGSTFGANLILGSPMGAGLKFFPYMGIGTNKFTRTGSPDLSEVGYTSGMGLGVGLGPKLSLIARGELNIVKTGETSRKFANATVGLTYRLIRSAKGGAK